MFEKDLVLPESQRGAFKEPIGREMDESELDDNAQTRYITVGKVLGIVEINAVFTRSSWRAR